MKVSNKFGSKSVYFKRTYYFPTEINERGYMTVVYYDRGKFIQSAQIVSDDLKNDLLKTYNA